MKTQIINIKSFIYSMEMLFSSFLNLFNTPVKENLLIIGIGYDNNLAFDTQKRTKDYTPTTNLNKQGGGSKEFRNFLNNPTHPLYQQNASY